MDTKLREMEEIKFDVANSIYNMFFSSPEAYVFISFLSLKGANQEMKTSHDSQPMPNHLIPNSDYISNRTQYFQ